MQIKVGARFKTNKGGDVVVVEYVNTENITVEFMDLHKHRVVTTKAVLLSGHAKNPYAPLLHGVGYFGVGEHKSKEGSSCLGYKRTQAYAVWVSMLSRCYDPGHDNSERYAHVAVDEDWYNYQNFADWYMNQIRNTHHNGRLQLDKDILSDELIYSASTCCVIPDVINMLVISVKGGKYLPGVRQSTNGLYRVTPGYACSSIRFNSETEAHLAYVQARVNKIKETAIQHKDQIDLKVFNALMTRDFRYKFSPLFEPEPKVTLH